LEGLVADNTLLNVGTGGDTLATEDVAGVKYELVKLVSGTAGATTRVGVGTGLEATALRVTIATDSTGVLSVDDNGGSLTIDGVLGANSGVDIGDVTINNAAAAAAVNIQDGGNSITVDWAGTAPPIGAGVEATALRVTLATDSTGVVSVDDNGASLTVDNAALSVVGGGVEVTAVRVTLASDSTGLISVDDNGGSLTVDGTVALGAGTAEIGKLAAGVANIGDVDVLTIAAGDNNIGNVDIVTLPALVAGTANIGDVDVLTLPALVAGTANIGDVDVLTIAAGDNNIGNVDIVTLPALVAGTANIGDVDILTVPAPLSTTGGGVEATALRVTLASDSTGLVSVDDNGASVTVDTAFVTVSTDVTRPADTAVYAVNDALSDSTSAPTAGGFTFTSAARQSGGSGIITDAVITTAADAATLLQGEIWLFNAAVTNINDNAAFAVSDAEIKTCLGKIAFTLEDAGNNGFYHATNLNIGFTCVGTANLRFLVRVKNVYTPVSAEVFTFVLKILQVT
jgi:hypothetical protein